MRNITYALLTLLSTPSALANTVTLEDHRCVNVPIGHVHTSIIDYNNYSRVPGALYQRHILGRSLDLLRMVRSEARYAVRETTRSDALVRVVLRPVSIDDEALFPRVVLRCRSEADSPAHFRHGCDLVGDQAHYAISNFSSRLEAIAESPECGPGETRLDYTLAIEMIADDVEAIKAEAVRPYGRVLAPLILAFFDEDKFFRAYYRQYYDSWAGTLQ